MGRENQDFFKKLSLTQFPCLKKENTNIYVREGLNGATNYKELQNIYKEPQGVHTP